MHFMIIIIYPFVGQVGIPIFPTPAVLLYPTLLPRHPSQMRVRHAPGNIWKEDMRYDRIQIGNNQKILLNPHLTDQRAQLGIFP